MYQIPVLFVGLVDGSFYYFSLIDWKRKSVNEGSKGKINKH